MLPENPRAMRGLRRTKTLYVANQVAAQSAAVDSAAESAEPSGPGRDSSPPAPTQTNPLRDRGRKGKQERTGRGGDGGSLFEGLDARSGTTRWWRMRVVLRVAECSSGVQRWQSPGQRMPGHCPLHA